MESGKYNNEDLSLDLELAGEELLCVKQQNTHLAKIPLKNIKAILDKKLDKDLSTEELTAELKNYGGSLSIKSTFSVDLTEPYEYGADADGNRGEMRQDFEDVEEDNLELEEANLSIIDENGDVAGVIDLTEFIQAKNDALIDFILTEINEDISSYVS